MREQFKHAWVHVRRSPYQALAAVVTMFATFLTATVIILIALGFEEILHFFETRPQVTVFLEDKVTQERREDLQNRLRQDNRVRDVHYVSQEEALKIYREQNKNDPLLLEMVTASILPASLEISTTRIEHLKEIADDLLKETGIEEVVYQEGLVKSLQNWTGTIRKAGLGLLAFLGLFSFLIILVVVGMKAAVRQEEVEILKLLGASFWYIRWPFVWEGVFYGLVGALLGWGWGYLLLLYSTPFLVNFLVGIPLLPVPFWVMMALLGGEIAVGMIIGLLGSLLAIRRYFR
jgi:cell division transport system permease protein